MNNIKRIPLLVMWLFVLVIAFTFVKYNWIMFTVARLSFAATFLIIGPLLVAANCELKFWCYKK